MVCKPRCKTALMDYDPDRDCLVCSVCGKVVLVPKAKQIGADKGDIIPLGAPRFSEERMRELDEYELLQDLLDLARKTQNDEG